jgi:creatinine amidohydrolase/Fe(II)-dependent formamide hydrolase-like protein
MIQVRSVMHPDASPPAGGDHAGINETSYMLAACPEAADLRLLGPDSPWYTRSPEGPSAHGSAERGERMFEAMAAAWVKELRGR